MNAHLHPAFQQALAPFAPSQVPATNPKEITMTAADTTYEPTVEELVDEITKAKAEESRANKIRVALEEILIARLGHKPEGAQTHELANGFKVTITGKMTYSADMELLTQLASNLPPNLRPIKVEPKLDETGAKYLRNNEPEVWAMLAPAITIQPAKTSVTIKV